MYRLKTLLGALALALLAPAAVLAQPDFTRYVAIGDSLTAGFQSGSLVVTGQRNSYPFLIYRQATGQSTGFEQPLVSEPGIPGQLELRSLVPLVIAPRPGQGSPTNLTLPRPYNNLGVPGARLRDTLVTFTGGLHDLVLRPSGFGNTTALQQAIFLNPTFVTIWIGNNDALAAATSGRVIEGVTLTPAAQFDTDFRALVAAVATQTSARMAIATIPDVTVIPFVNTVPTFITNPATGERLALLGPDGRLTPDDRVLLPASSVIGQGGVGITVPLPDNLVLSASELSTISSRIQAYNNTIRAVANERNAALVDTNAFLTQAAQGHVGVGGIVFTPAFLTGGVFSLDGVHPTPAGYAFVANQFIEAINARFGGRIPMVNLFPFVFSGTGPTAAATSTATAADALSEPAPDFIFTEEARQSLLQALRIDPDPKSPSDE